MIRALILIVVFVLGHGTLRAGPFSREEIVFYNGTIKLAGTLFMPSAGGKHPAIAITHGSGRDSRKHQGFIMQATFLVERGFVVLIYDKRGVGDSSGEYMETPDLNVPASDLIEAVNFLTTRGEVDATRIGVYGHSQGGWVAPLAAANSETISFVVVSCGGGISVREQVLSSYKATFRNLGFGNETDSAIAFARKLYPYLGTGKGYAELSPIYEAASRKPWFSFFSNMGFSNRLPPPSMLGNPAFTFFRNNAYDPVNTERALKVPVLVMLATNDEIVPSAIAREKWKAAFTTPERTTLLTVVDIPGEDHFEFKREGSGIIYKRAFAQPLAAWLEKTILK